MTTDQRVTGAATVALRAPSDERRSLFCRNAINRQLTASVADHVDIGELTRLL